MSVAGFNKGIKDIYTLQEAMGIRDYSLFAQKIMILVEEGKLQPTKKGKETNGKYPPLAQKYRIIEKKETSKESEKEQRLEIRRRFPLLFKKDYYLQHLLHYERDRDILLLICDYHKHGDRPLIDCMSVNERLFDMFNHEKNISINEVIGILSHLGLDQKYLNIYETPEPFIFFSAKEDLDQAILIIENKDTWYTLRKLKQEGIGHFDSLIYGEGKKILKSFEEIGQHQKAWFNNFSNVYYYFGDMDDEGSWIFKRLQEIAFEKGIQLVLWEEAYATMYSLGEKNNKWRYYKEQKSLDSSILESIYGFLNSEDIDNLMLKFSQNLYIPQEITNYRVLKNLISEEE